MKIINNLSEIYHKYDLFLIDQWGVLHNGIRPYPRAVNVLVVLMELNKRVYLISNSSKSAKYNRSSLDSLKIQPGRCYTDVITSGQCFLDDKQLPAKIGTNAYVFNFSEYEKGQLDNTKYQQVFDLNKADFILANGFNDSYPFSHYTNILDKALAKKMPLVCTNVDMHFPSQDGTNRKCPGHFFKYYQMKGGKTFPFGKPFKKIYEAIPKDDIPKDRSRVLVIGDSLEHDIKGSTNFLADSVLIANGIHKQELINNKGQISDISNLNSKLADLSQTYQASPPTYIQVDLK